MQKQRNKLFYSYLLFRQSTHLICWISLSLILIYNITIQQKLQQYFGCICNKLLLCEQEKIYTDLTTPPLLIARSCSEVSLRLISPLCEPSGLLRPERGTLSPTIVSNQVSLRSRLPSRRVTCSVMQSALQHVTWHLRMKSKLSWKHPSQCFMYYFMSSASVVGGKLLLVFSCYTSFPDYVCFDNSSWQYHVT